MAGGARQRTMKKTIELKIGRNRFRLPLPAAADVLNIREPEKTVSAAGFAADMDGLLASQPPGGCRVAVVVADKTRLCAYNRYLPVLLDRLGAHGAKPADTTVYIAYGTHPAQSDAESRHAYGEVFSRCRFVQHDCTDASLFTDLGRTSRGTPVRLRRDILEADRLITVGAVSHHYFAGFGGGRKLIFPGLGYRADIYHNHGLFLDRQQRTLAPGCRPGRLDGNPLAEDLAEIEAHRPADIAVHGILNSQGVVCRLMAGRGVPHFRQACQCHGRNCETGTAGGYDTVVASCGGHPKDINFIQAHKALHHAAAFVNDHGTLILFARCRDGIGSETFLPWFDMGGWDAAFDHLSSAYRGNGGTALAMMEKARRIRILLVTDLPPEVCRTMGADKSDARSAAHRVARCRGSLAVIPNASLLVRR
ncbi:hypothetical protein DSCA_62740 [Desulfosarcina alkanivorans]|uniref:Uncharacterized protein n=2 Tax=Desulfosarcina alkanivorans TaxID=571177 RepID=A0A5K7Z1H9_9BACT|nr:hypothetical protein DSCA_62740 [Desulfosarcina alkanivorans]